MGCFGSKAAKACAEAELAAAQARFPATEVDGPSEKLGMGRFLFLLIFKIIFLTLM